MHSAAPPTSSGNRRSNTRATRLKSEWTVPCSIEFSEQLSGGGTPRIPRIARAPAVAMAELSTLFPAVGRVAAIAPADGEVARERPLLADRRDVAPVEYAAAQGDLPPRRRTRLRRSLLEAVEVAQPEHEIAFSAGIVGAEQ